MSEYFYCTKDNPWNSFVPSNLMIRHEGVWIGEYDGGDIDEYQCKNCNQKYVVGH